MNKTTLLRAYDTCRGRQSSIVANRSKGNSGVAVNDDLKALEWQRLDRIAGKCFDRIQSRLTAADALADVAKAAILDIYAAQTYIWEMQTDGLDNTATRLLQAAIDKLDPALSQYGGTT